MPGYVADYIKEQQDERDGMFDTVEQERLWRYGSMEDNEAIAEHESYVIPSYKYDNRKEEEHDKEQEREWHERQTERIPSWMDEEQITAERYEEGPQERESGPRVRVW